MVGICNYRITILQQNAHHDTLFVRSLVFVQTLESRPYSPQLFPAPRSEVQNGLKGPLIAIGGKARKESLKSVIDHLDPEGLLVVVTPATRYPRKSFYDSRVAFEELGHTNVTSLDYRDFRSKRRRVLPSETRGVYIVGGNQIRLMDRTSQGQFIEELHEQLELGRPVSGTSAGASIMSEIMPVGRYGYEKGYGLTGAIVDQHMNRNPDRLQRLARLVSLFPDSVGIGIDENTAAIMNGNSVQVMGEGNVYVLRSSTAEENSVNELISVSHEVLREGLPVEIVPSLVSYVSAA